MKRVHPFIAAMMALAGTSRDPLPAVGTKRGQGPGPGPEFVFRAPRYGKVFGETPPLIDPGGLHAYMRRNRT